MSKYAKYLYSAEYNFCRHFGFKTLWDWVNKKDNIIDLKVSATTVKPNGLCSFDVIRSNIANDKTEKPTEMTKKYC